MERVCEQGWSRRERGARVSQAGWGGSSEIKA